MPDYDAIIIGSGAGGLAAALTLARRNLSVLLLEAMPEFGGYLNSFSRKGYSFDPGVHYIGELAEGEQFYQVLEELGLSEAAKFVELNPDAIDRYCFPDFEICLCKGKERFKERLLSTFPKEERAINKFLETMDKMVDALRDAESLQGGLLSTLNYLTKHPVMLKYGSVPYQKLLDDLTSDQRLQAVLAAICGDYGMPPAKSSVLIALAVWAHFFTGGYYPHGGSGTLRDAFVSALRAHGATLKNRSPVVSINKQGDEFIVGTESQEQFTARAVISNAEPAITLGTLINPALVPKKVKEKVARLRPSVGCFYAFLGTDLDLPSLGITDSNLIHYSGYDINKMYEVMLAPTPPEEFHFFFLTSPSVKDPKGKHAPEGRYNLEIITLLSYEAFEKWAHLPPMKRGEEYNALKQQIGERLITAAERYVPGLSQHLDFVEFATPLSNEYWAKAVRGGMYGPEHSPDQFGPGRFMSFTCGIDGLFLAGSGTIGCGVAACTLSGTLAAHKAATHLQS